MRAQTRTLSILGLFAVLSTVMTYPMVFHIMEAIPGPPADNFEVLYRIWWFKHSLFDLGISPFFNSDVFYPFGYDLSLGESTLANMAFSLPVTLAGGHVLSYNLIMWITFALSGFGMYLWAYRVIGHRGAAVVAGVVYAYCPYRLLHLTSGQIAQVSTQWLPLIFLCLDRVLERRDIRAAALAGVFYALTALSAWYYLAIAGLFVALYGILRARPWREAFRDRSLWRCGLIFVAVVAMFLGPLVVRNRSLLWGDERGYSLWYVDALSPSLNDLFFPRVLRPLWGGEPLNQDEYDFSVHLYLGIPALILAAVGVWKRWEPLVKVMLIVGLVALVLSLGLRLRWDGGPVLIPVPPAVEKAFTAGMGILAKRLALYPAPSYYMLREPGAVYIPLPALLLRLFVPSFQYVRQWSRFLVLTLLTLAMLAGFGVAVITQHLGGRALWVTALLIILSMFDSAILPYRFGLCAVGPQPVDEWLATQLSHDPVAEFPYYRLGGNGPLLYRTVYHGKPIVSGASTFVPLGHREARPVLVAFPEKETLVLLRRWGVRYIVVSSAAYGADWPPIQEALTAQPDLRYVASFEDVPVYRDGRLLDIVPEYELSLPLGQQFVYEIINH